MGVQDQAFAFDSPAAAVAEVIARLGDRRATRPSDSACWDGLLGRVLAEAVIADQPCPAFDLSAMDGFAIRVGDLTVGASLPDGVTLEVVGDARIGAAPPAMPATRSAMRIATGSPIPSGADTVVKREDVIEHDGGESVTLLPRVIERIRAGDHIRRRGENVGGGEVVLRAGSVLSAAAIGTLASVGCVSPRVWPRVRVAIITTGDELVPPQQTPGAYQIRNSNLAVGRAAIAARPWAQVVSEAHVPDDAARIAGALGDAITGADAVILTGGVSVGHRDPVRAAIERQQGQVIFHGLPQRPGKPMLAAMVVRSDGGGVPIFGLPGNPVSAMVTCERIVVPVLATMAGAARRPVLRVTLSNADGRSLGMWWHRLVCLDDEGGVRLVDTQGSGDIVGAGRCDGFIEVAPGAPTVRGEYPFYPWPT